MGMEADVSEFQTVHPETGMGIGANWGSAILGQRIMGGETGLERGRPLGGGGMPGPQGLGVKGMDITINAGRAFVNIGGEQVEMTQWALEDQSRGMRREDQLWQQGMARTQFEQRAAYQVQQFGFQDRERGMQYGRQMQQFGFAQEGLDLTRTQFMERQGLQRQQFQWQTQYQREQMGIQYERQQTQFGWQEEDLAFKGAQTTMQFGWQMEDIGENLRYATGRQRRQLMRQRERATISFGMGMGQLGEQGERLDQRREWAEEDHNRARSYFEMRVQWQQREMDTSRRHFEERHSLSQRRLDADQEHFQETFEFQGERIEAEREYWGEQQANALAILVHTENQTTAYHDLQEAMTAVQRATTLQVSEFSAMFDSGGAFERARNALSGLFDYIEKRANAVTGDYSSVVQGDPYGPPGHEEF